MNIYKVERLKEVDYDEYDSFVVVATSSKIAVKYHPDGGLISKRKSFHGWPVQDFNDSEDIKVTYVGVAGSEFKNGDVIVSSYNAG